MNNISYSFILRQDRTLKDGSCAIYLRLIQHRRPRYFTLGFSALPEQWDEAKELPNRKHPQHHRLKSYINKLKGDIERVSWSHIINGNSITIDELTYKLQLVGNSNTMDVFEYYDVMIERMKNTGRVGYANVYKESRRQVSKFVKRESLSFHEINYIFLTKWDEALFKRGLSPTSIHNYLRTLKTLINNARKEGIVDQTYDPFKEYSFSKYRKTKTRKKALEKRILDQIKKMEFPESSSLFLTKSFFLFSYYCRGINFVDMAHLKWSDISDNCLFYTRKKTSRPFNLKLERPVLDILDYFEKNKKGGNDFIFPILSDLHETPIQKDYRIEKVLKRVNRDLKVISKTLGLYEHITFYAARHTFATVAKKAGIPVAVISEAMGHQTERTTNIYLDSFENEDLNNAFAGVL